jgi:hypothetical protein
MKKIKTTDNEVFYIWQKDIKYIKQTLDFEFNKPEVQVIHRVYTTWGDFTVDNIDNLID